MRKLSHRACSVLPYGSHLSGRGVVYVFWLIGLAIDTSIEVIYFQHLSFSDYSRKIMSEKENLVRNDDVDVIQVSDILGKILMEY